MMTWERVRVGCLAILGAALAIVAMVLAWSYSGSQQVSAEVPAPGLDFSVAVEGEAGCETSDGDTQCYLDPGSTFTVNVNLNSLPDGVSTYEGVDVFITYEGVSSKDNGSLVWPDCAFPATWFEVGEVGLGCAVGVPPAGPSTYTGVMVTNDFNCTESESSGNTIVLRHGLPDTSLTEAVGYVHAEGDGTSETLIINCGEAPPTPTEAPETPQATATVLPTTGDASGIAEDGGVSAGLWIVIGALLAAAAVGLGAFGWTRARAR